MATQRLAVLHWFPLEYYPPATNLLRYFADRPDWQVAAFTCRNDRGRAAFQHANVQIARCQFPAQQHGVLRKLCSYVSFPLIVFWRLVAFRPDVVLYFEPHSSFPAFLYCLIARRCRLFVHHHEYYEGRAFQERGMRVVKFYHWIERKWLFNRAEWISQTNVDRLSLFRKDHPRVDDSKLHALPNLPPRMWADGENEAWKHGTRGGLRLLYIGALSLRDTFVKNLVQWVRSDGTVGFELDIFSYNYDSETARFLKQCCGDRVRFHDQGIEYDRIPTLARGFHVGLILYKGNTQNYVYNASNKLFEYLAAGLDVWYPKQMLGVKPYARLDRIPRVIELDFENLENVDCGLLRHRGGLPVAPPFESCETTLNVMASRLAGSPDG